MAIAIMAGQDFGQLGWDGCCRLSAQAARDLRPHLALAITKVSSAVNFTHREDGLDKLAGWRIAAQASAQ